MKPFMAFLLLSLSIAASAFPGLPMRARNAVQTTEPSRKSPENIVRTAMKNVDFHLTDTIVVHIATLEGRLAPDGGEMPVFDDKKSFHLEVDTAQIQVGTQALSNDLNDYVFAKPDAPLKKLAITTQGDELVLKGLLASKGDIPFETEGTVSSTPEGQIRIHTLKVKALHLPVKGLMDMLGLDTAKLIDTKKLTGITVDKDDLILDPAQILPPPAMRGHLSSIKVENGGISLVFGTAVQKDQRVALTSRCGGRNYQLFRGGVVRFGKMTMNDTDLELIDMSPADPFDFSIDHYQEQLVAGYAKMTKIEGLCVHVPDLNKISQTSKRPAR
ncbi:MAG: hypothetical protein LV481_00925 [Methylacidiphilales bacterium]|jgi:hypothetical protein|nr:hypothetical protein [Candidatus Methylacidiphilales bacterium]